MASAPNEFEIGLFPTPEDAHYAVQDLMTNGIPRDAIGVATNETPETPEHEQNLAAPAAMFGVVEGIIYGGILGLMLGLAAMFFIPPGVITIGPAAIAIGGAVLGALIAGSVGYWVGFHIPRDEADYYAEGLTGHATAVSVKVDQRTRPLVAAILDRDGAVDVEMKEANSQTEALNDLPLLANGTRLHA